MYRYQLLVMICIHTVYIFYVSKCHDTGGNPKLQNEQVELSSNETEAIEFLEQFNKRAGVVYHQESLAEWNYYVNLTEHNRDMLVSIIYEH